MTAKDLLNQILDYNYKDVDLDEIDLEWECENP